MRFFNWSAQAAILAMGLFALTQGPFSQAPFNPGLWKDGPDGSAFWTDTVTPMMHPTAYNLEVAKAFVTAALSAEGLTLAERRSHLEAARDALRDGLRARARDGPSLTLLASVEARLGETESAKVALGASARALPHSPRLANERLRAVSLLRRSLTEAELAIATQDFETLRRDAPGDLRTLVGQDRFLALLCRTRTDGC